MKILVIKSSPHVNGSSNHLADQFIKGAKEKGHEIVVFDAGHTNLHPCLACDYCKSHQNQCVQRDDMQSLQKTLLMMDMVVFVTPLYYYGISAQLKMVIDRFYGFNDTLMAKKIKSAFISAAWEDESWTMTDIKNHYLTICRYLQFDNQGLILGTNCGTLEMTKNTDYPQKAYEFGQSL